MTDNTKTPPTKKRRNRPPSVAFCSEHGRLDKVDEDGLCPSCGATSMGDAIDELIADHAQLRAERDQLRDALSELLEMCIPTSRLETTRGMDAMRAARAALSVEVKTK